MYNRPVAAFWSGKFWQDGQQFLIDYGVDFPMVPAGVNAIDVDLTLSPGVTGAFILKHVGGVEAGRVDPRNPQKIIRVYLGADRKAGASVQGGNAGVLMALAGYLVKP